MSEADAIVNQLLVGLQQAANAVTPSFVETMPRAYFDDTTPAMRLAHLKAIIAAEASGDAQSLMVRDADGHHFTFISNQSYRGQLSEYVQRLPRDMPLTSAKVFTSKCGDRIIDIFTFGEHSPCDHSDAVQRAHFDAAHQYAMAHQEAPTSEAIERHLCSCDAGYLVNTSVEQVLRHLKMAEQIRERGNMLTKLEAYSETSRHRLTLGFVACDPRSVFERVSHFLGEQKIDINRAHLDRFIDFDGDITLLTFIVDLADKPFDESSEHWQHIDFTLRHLPYLDNQVFTISREVTNGNLLAAEVLLALTHLVHQKLVERGPLTFSRDRMLAALKRFPELAMAVSDLFQLRFAYPGNASGAKTAEVLEKITCDTDTQEVRDIFSSLTEAANATLRTNLFLRDRQALALRIDPGFLTSERREELPFGVFFVSGNRFDAFHVRFRDIARGGVRIVRPRSVEQYALETERLYDEAYGLAYAQQQKNKDIPEGGSKAVILAAPDARFAAVGRAFADALLDLIIPDAQLFSVHADYLARDELLYLGPDENIDGDLIGWIVERARLRGHPMPDAFMSSKAGAGINHKEYGVTSEGITVFLEHALRAVDIDPRRQAFSVKLTGGPDGDVAGNEILILDREFGANARIVAISDGSGCAEDPDGLDSDELKRLVQACLPISRFDVTRLGARGRIVEIDQPGGIHLRNTLHERVIADAFIPAGGRPGTINENNWQNFLLPDGQPSSRVIVEGANLFVTPQARALLSDRGVLIIKDSSANKAGVICSSFEIVASMLLDEPGFLAIKHRYVKEVLDKLRALAHLEALTLLREHSHKPTIRLPVLSERLSRTINRATDTIATAVEGWHARHADLVQQVLIDYLPASLYETVGSKIFTEIPEAYLHRIIASALASRIVYREGLDWIETMPEENIAQLAERYLVEEGNMHVLVQEIRASDCPNRERIALLLESGGTATALKLTQA